MEIQRHLFLSVQMGHVASDGESQNSWIPWIQTALKWYPTSKNETRNGEIAFKKHGQPSIKIQKNGHKT